MELTNTEKIKIILKREKITVAELANRLGQSRQNLQNKLSRSNFTATELEEIALAMGYKYISYFQAHDGTKI